MGGLPNTRGFDLLNLPGVAVQPNLTYSASTFDSAKILWAGCSHCWQVREILGVEEMEGGGRVTPSLGGLVSFPNLLVWTVWRTNPPYLTFLTLKFDS